jgi:transposase
MLYAGIDVHKRFCQVVLMTEAGEVVKQGRVETSRRALAEFFSEKVGVRIAIESSGLWVPVYEWLESMSHAVKLAHPLKTKAIAYARIKTDKIDAETLAHLLRTDLLPESYVPPKDIRELRELCRERKRLVEERTRWKNRIHAELAKNGILDAPNNLFTLGGLKWLSTLCNPRISRYLEVINTLDKQIRTIDAALRSTVKDKKEIRLLMSIPGVGKYSATLIYAEIGDVNRFPDAEHLCAYMGLVPSTHQSGDTMRHGHITKEGPAEVRRALTECVQIHVAKYDTPLTRFYRRVKRRRGTQVATVATARKLLKVVYRMLRDETKFRVEGDFDKKPAAKTASG